MLYFDEVHLFRWTVKKENGVADIADIVVARLRRLANSVSENEIQESLKDFCSWGRYKGKLKAWFEGVYLLVRLEFLGLSISNLSKKKSVKNFILSIKVVTILT